MPTHYHLLHKLTSLQGSDNLALQTKYDAPNPAHLDPRLAHALAHIKIQVAALP